MGRAARSTDFAELVQVWDVAEGAGYKPALMEIAREAESLVRRDIVRGQELADLEELEDVPEVEAAIEVENANLAEAEKAAEAHLTP